MHTATVTTARPRGDPLWIMGPWQDLIFLVTIVWGWRHYLMQIYGFVRIYDAKMGPSVALTRRLDRAMCIAWFAAAVLLSDTPLYGYLDRLAACGVSLPPTEWFVSLRHVTLAALVVVTALFAANLVRLGCHGQAGAAGGSRDVFPKIAPDPTL